MAGKAVPEIVIDGTPFGPITLLSLDQPWNGHHSFSLVCPFRERANSLMDLGQRFVGKPISINLRAGLRETSGELTFRGVITNVKLSKHESSVMQLVLQGSSPTRLLDDGPHNRTFTDKTLADITAEVIAGVGSLDTVTDLTYTDPIPYLTQYRETAFGFLHRLCGTYGEWFYYDGERVVIGSPPDGDEVELVFGRDLNGLDISADVVPANFKLLGYDYVGDEHFAAPARQARVRDLDDLTQLMLDASDDLFVNEPAYAFPLLANGQPELDQLAERRKSGQSAELINLFGECSRLDLRVGQVVRARALPSTMGSASESAGADYGSFRLLHLTHHCDGLGNYHNTFQGIPAKLKMPPVAEARIAPPAAETQPAEVTDNKDPEQLGRVQVQFAWQKESGETTPWVRVAAAGAGGGHGAYFVPEVGDQVMVGFEYNNPDRPVVMGSLYHGKVKPANAADPDNNSKIIRTRSGNQVVLSDAGGQESITLTNGSNIVTLSLEGPGSITLTTAGDLSLFGKNVSIVAEEILTLSAGTEGGFSAGTTLDVGAADGVTVNGGKTVDLTANNVTVSAGQGFTASGGATAEISSANTTLKADATVTVSAPMVKLN
ncbi:type VI secretion system Vgr family protein [Lewinella sp. IMCC34183]|uniref:type VI secretion system Vgr family protein n=1 Tax=Lewinella sp. IMCC34183 TaxID=2248762 RepID=UPI000E24EAC4|nr:phage baseplate assembly protein V [Lewinella sp. IMCC34183]